MRRLVATTIIVGLLAPSLAFSGSTAPGQTSMARDMERYVILPVPRGNLETALARRADPAKHFLLDSLVRDPEGKLIGTLENLIFDTKSGQIEYGVVSLADTDRLVPVPWSSFNVNRHKGYVELNAKAKDLRPEMNAKLQQDHSPSIKQLVHDIEQMRAAGWTSRQGLGITTRPAAGTPFGVGETGGAGPSGPRALPPGPAPQFEGAGR